DRALLPPNAVLNSNRPLTDGKCETPRLRPAGLPSSPSRETPPNALGLTEPREDARKVLCGLARWADQVEFLALVAAEHVVEDGATRTQSEKVKPISDCHQDGGHDENARFGFRQDHVCHPGRVMPRAGLLHVVSNARNPTRLSPRAYPAGQAIATNRSV